ncbi:MAG: hypothetical protein DRQ55_17510, partial [Planctomycetota bacterium]
MPTELREAKIRVVLDLKDSKEEADSLEERTEKTRKDQKDAERDADRPGKGTPGKKISMRDVRFGTLVNAFKSALLAIPLAGLAIGVAEANERLGPGAASFLEGVLPDSVRKVLAALGLDAEVSADMARWWGENKTFLTAITAGAERTTAMTAAISRTGGNISPGEAWDEFNRQRRFAETQANIEKTRRRILQMTAGAGVGEAMKRALDNAGRPGVGR